jgi:hypothetical protein
MTIRPFDWRDLPVLIRYRHQGLIFDNALILTRGSTLIPTGAIFFYFAQATGIFTYLSTGDHKHGPLLGQVHHSPGSSLARISFLAPQSAIHAEDLPALMEYMVVEAGGRGALHLRAEVDDRTEAFEMLRGAGFAIYVRQRIWQLNDELEQRSQDPVWQVSKDSDLIPVRVLYNNLVPGLVQQVEPPPSDPLVGLIYRRGEDILAYVELKYGSRGILVQPLIHPDAEGVTADLVKLLLSLPNRRSRPVYICVRSYQSWIEHSLEGQGAQPGPQQAVMVKHLAITKRVMRSFALPALETGQPEATAPFVHSENNHK